MAASGKMRRVHEAWVDSPTTPRTNQFDWEQAAMDMEHMTGARATQRYSHIPQFNYRDDVGPGTGQKQDHALHDQYFMPVPQIKGSFPADEDEVEVGNTGHVHPVQDTKVEPPNLLHSPVDTKAPFSMGPANNESYYGDKKDGHQNWV
jgi:hypothetical protein